MQSDLSQRIVRLARLKAAAYSRRQSGKITAEEFLMLSEQLDALIRRLVQESPSETIEELVSALDGDPLPVPLNPFRRWLEEDRREQQAQQPEQQKATPEAAPEPTPAQPSASRPQPSIQTPKVPAAPPPPPIIIPASAAAQDLPVLEDEPELLEAFRPQRSAQDRVVQQESGWNKYLKPFLSENWMGLIGAVSLTAAWLMLAMWLLGQGHMSVYLIGYPPLALFTLGMAWLSRKMQDKGPQASQQLVALFSLLSLLSIPFYFVLAGGLAQEEGISGAGLAALSALGILWVARRFKASLGHNPTAFLLVVNLLLFAALLAGPQAGLWVVLPGGLLALCRQLGVASKADPDSFPFCRTAFTCHYLLAGVMACLFLRSVPDAGLFALLLQPAAWAAGRFWKGQPARLAGMGLSLLGVLVGLNSEILPLVALLALCFWFLQWRSFGESFALEFTAIHLPFLAWAVGDSQLVGLTGAYLLWTAYPALAAVAALEAHAGRATRVLTLGGPLVMALTAAQAALDPLAASAVASLLVLAAGAGLGCRALVRGSEPLWLFNLLWTPGCLYFCLSQQITLALFLGLAAVAWLALSALLPHALVRRSSTAVLWFYSLAAALAQTAALIAGGLGVGQVLGTLAALTALCGAARRSSSMLPVYCCFPPGGLLAFRLAMAWGIRLESGLGAALAASALLLAAPHVQRLLARRGSAEDEGTPSGRAFPLVSRDFVREPLENLSILLGFAGLLQALLALAPLTDRPMLALAFPLQMAYWCLLALRRRPDWAWPCMPALLGLMAGLIWCLPWYIRPAAAALALALLLTAAGRLQSSTHPIARLLAAPLHHTSRVLLYLGVPAGLVADLYLTRADFLWPLGLQVLLSVLLIDRFLVPHRRPWSHLALVHGAVFWFWAFWSWRTQTGIPFAVGLDLLSGAVLLLLAAAWLLRGPLQALQPRYSEAVRIWLAGSSLLLALTLLSSSGRAWGAAVPRESFWAAAVAAAAAYAHFRFGITGRAEVRPARLEHFSTALGVMLFWPLSVRLLPEPAAVPYLALAPALYQLLQLERGLRRQARLGPEKPSSWRLQWAAGLLATAVVAALAHPLFESLLFPDTPFVGVQAPWRNAPALLLIGLALLRLNRHRQWTGFSLPGTVLAAAAAVLAAAQLVGPGLPRPGEAVLTVLTGHALLAMLYFPNPLRTAIFRFAGLEISGKGQYIERVFLTANTAIQLSALLLMVEMAPGDLRVLALLALAVSGLLYDFRDLTTSAALLEAGLLLSLGLPILYREIAWQYAAAGLAALLALPVLLRRRSGKRGYVPDGTFLILWAMQLMTLLRGGILGLDSCALLLAGFVCWLLLPDRPFKVSFRYAHFFWVFWIGYFLFCLNHGLDAWVLPVWAVGCIWPPILLHWGLALRPSPRPWAKWGGQAAIELSLSAAAIGGLGLALDWDGVLFSLPLLAALEVAFFTTAGVFARRAIKQERRREPGQRTLGSSLALATAAEVMVFAALGLLRLKSELELGTVLDGYLLLGLAGIAAGMREVMRRSTPAFDGFFSRATQLYAWLGWGWMLYLDLSGGGGLHGFTGAVLLSGLYAWLSRRGRRFNLVPAFAFGNAALFLLYSDLDVYHPLLYIFPTVSSVLVLAHLLRYKLEEGQMKSIRLACSLALLGSSAFYNLVAFEDNLSYPLLAALVALAGVVAGISLRIRIYLYMGTFFFIFNTLAILIQMVRLQPADNVKLLIGLLFLATGLLFTGAFALFQTHRQAILRRYDLLRLELKEWD